MTLSTSSLKQSFTPESMNLTYGYNLAGLWNGIYEINQNFAPDSFDETTKSQMIDQNLFDNAFELWDSYSAFTLTKTTGTPSISVYRVDDIFPINGSNDEARVGYLDEAGDTVAQLDNFTNGGFARAEIAFDDVIASYGENVRLFAYLHEIGHTLGLSGDHAASAFNTDQTVMTYSIAGGNRYAVTPMAYDILALEEIYGASQNETGNTSYSTSGNWITGGNRSLTIKDDGGVDEIDLSGIAGDHIINLKEAIDAQGQWTDSATIVNGQEYIYLAKGTVIENATGGSGNDTLIGNGADNVLFGGSGTDTFTFSGSFGDDVVAEGEKLFIDDVEVNGEAKQVAHGSDEYRLAA